MLVSIRNKTKGWISYLIIGLIIIPFALFGISEYFTGASNIKVASFDGVDISKEEFLSEFNPQKRWLQKELDKKYDKKFDFILKQSILNQMLNKHLLEQLSRKLSYETTTSELNNIIRANDLFKEEGRFSLEKYKKLLRLNGYTTEKYETIKLQELRRTQIKSNLLDSAFITPSQLLRLQKLNDQKRKFSYIIIQTDNHIKEVKVDAQSVKDFYDNKKSLFFAPEQVKIEFIELSLNEIAKKIKVSDNELFNFYENEQENFTTEEERQAQHILLTDELTAQKVVTLLDNGGDFVKLAKQYSQDSGSKDDAGNLGFFTRGIMVPEFEKKVFAMKSGEVSDLVKSKFGYHIIKLNNIKVKTLKSFDIAKQEILDLYIQKQAQKVFYNLTEQLASLAYETSLEKIVDQMDLKLQVSDFFDKRNTQLNQKIVTTAFSDMVLNKGENSEVLELSKDKLMVIRVREKLVKRQKSFSEVKSEINTHLMTLLAKTFVDNLAKNIVDLLVHNDKDTLEKIMIKNKLKWHRVGWIKRDSNKVKTTIVNKVFALAKPINSKSSYSAQNLERGNAIVIDLLGVKTTDIKIVNAVLEKSLLSFESNEVFSNILEMLKSQAEIKIFSRNL
ncbi:SurA N-terminal domain-containing protein [Candidatus Vesicomyidisocius calyptogenae]|uniref:Periplasmic chaperone PpiD n=1 Tax=Vesicomyosocius okutanii subsp. Calyptogena okutanii (strain HA) TaxID=412965 RepID=A5CWG5_VESOH|nr:SurA N-terminal domain-containing protein [Candidatus Vesicomyosocius okutanii]BAF61716.1 peptidyl-prolyl cis-trans isomerase D [Candidatus Vesicomyosocius okutanii]